MTTNTLVMMESYPATHFFGKDMANRIRECVWGNETLPELPAHSHTHFDHFLREQKPYIRRYDVCAGRIYDQDYPLITPAHRGSYTVRQKAQELGQLDIAQWVKNSDFFSNQNSPERENTLNQLANSYSNSDIPDYRLTGSQVKQVRACVWNHQFLPDLPSGFLFTDKAYHKKNNNFVRFLEEVPQITKEYETCAYQISDDENDFIRPGVQKLAFDDMAHFLKRSAFYYFQNNGMTKEWILHDYVSAFKKPFEQDSFLDFCLASGLLTLGTLFGLSWGFLSLGSVYDAILFGRVSGQLYLGLACAGGFGAFALGSVGVAIFGATLLVTSTDFGKELSYWQEAKRLLKK